MRQYYVYIVANERCSVLYTGVTNDLARRMYEHRYKLISGFTAKYNTNILVYYEVFSAAYGAIAAEKKIKAWRREKKIDLIKTKNPLFENLMRDN